MYKCVIAFTSLLTICSFAHAELVVLKGKNRIQANIHAEPNGRSAVIGTLSGDDGLDLVPDASHRHWRAVSFDGGTRFMRKGQTRVVGTELPVRDNDEIRAHFLNVGTGSCALVECPGTDAPVYMVDCGAMGGLPNTTSTQLIERVTSKVDSILEANSARDFNLILSHADRDHIRLIPKVLGSREPDHIWLGGSRALYDPNNTDKVREWLAARQAQIASESFDDNHTTFGGDGLDCGDANAHILTTNTGDSKNANSLVVEFRHGDYGLTITGDAEGSTEAQALTNADGSVNTTVITGSHHGADTEGSNSPSWVNAATPAMVVFSAGTRFGHPRCSILTPYENHAATVPRHRTHCGIDNKNQETRPANKAIYTTLHSGDIVVTSGGTSPLDVYCETSIRCRGTVAF